MRQGHRSGGEGVSHDDSSLWQVELDMLRCGSVEAASVLRLSLEKPVRARLSDTVSDGNPCRMCVAESEICRSSSYVLITPSLHACR